MDAVPTAAECVRAGVSASSAVDGELRDPREVGFLRRHLAGCPECARRFAEMRLVAAVLQHEPLEPSPARTRRGPR